MLFLLDPMLSPTARASHPAARYLVLWARLSGLSFPSSPHSQHLCPIPLLPADYLLYNSVPCPFALSLAKGFVPVPKTTASASSHSAYPRLLGFPLPPPLKPYYVFAPAHLYRQNTRYMKSSPCNAKLCLEVPLPICTPVISTSGGRFCPSLLCSSLSSPGTRQQAGMRLPPPAFHH